MIPSNKSKFNRNLIVLSRVFIMSHVCFNRNLSQFLSLITEQEVSHIVSEIQIMLHK